LLRASVRGAGAERAGAGLTVRPLSVAAMAFCLRYGHAIGYERLSGLFAHLFGLAISEGALANVFQRTQPAFAAQTTAILANLRESPVIASDETSALVESAITGSGSSRAS
jgi:transposase